MTARATASSSCFAVQHQRMVPQVPHQGHSEADHHDKDGNAATIVIVCRPAGAGDVDAVLPEVDRDAAEDAEPDNADQTRDHQHPGDEVVTRLGDIVVLKRYRLSRQHRSHPAEGKRPARGSSS